MTTQPNPSVAADIAAALTREHHEIDSGIEEFVAGAENGEVHTAPLLTAFAALRRHIYLEEAFLFPPIQAAGMTMPIMIMVREHGTIWDAMDAVESTVHDSGAEQDLPLDACRQLLSLLDQHNMKEEPVVYPRADLDLTDEARDELAVFLRDGCTPGGWVCQAASR